MSRDEYKKKHNNYGTIGAIEQVVKDAPKKSVKKETHIVENSSRESVYGDNATPIVKKRNDKGCATADQARS